MGAITGNAKATGMERWAIYYAPETDSALWQLGSRWLGRDAASGERFDPPAGMAPAAWQALVATPAHYGLHATLKPPFQLADGAGAAALIAAARDLAAAIPAFTTAPLEIASIGDFLALQPRSRCAELDHLAARCLRELDGFRAPRERPAPGNATPRQRALNAQWGYPYVLDEFRFHITLTGPVARHRHAELKAVLARQLAGALDNTPLAVTAIAAYRQASAKAPFERLERLALGAPAT